MSGFCAKNGPIPTLYILTLKNLYDETTADLQHTIIIVIGIIMRGSTINYVTQGSLTNGYSKCPHP